MTHILHRLSILTLASTASICSFASAGDLYWVGYQNNCMVSPPDTGSFHHGDNWLNFTPAGAADQAFFGSGIDPQGNGVNPHYIYFGDFCVNASGCPNSIPVPGGGVVNTVLRMQSDHWVFDFLPGSLNCTPPGSANGSYSTSLHALVGANITASGLPGSASLRIVNGTLSVGTTLYVAAHPNTDGHVMIDGLGALLQTGNATSVGSQGDGELTVTNGALLTTGAGSIIGDQATATGKATISGSGSGWTQANDLWIGNQGDGVLNISAGAQVTTNGWSLIGNTASSVGQVTVSGGATWNHGLWTTVGAFGRGELTIIEASQVSVAHARVGGESGSDSDLIVDGVGSSLASTGHLVIGGRGIGQLEIRGGASVSSGGYARLAESVGSMGDASVTGTGSAWDVTGDLWVAGDGMGSLTISDGARVSNSGWALLGAAAGASAAMTVEGSSSTWSSTLWTTIGGGGAADLVIRDQALVDTQGANIGVAPGSVGKVTVDGPGTQWSNTAGMNVGQDGSGTLALADGGLAAVAGNVVFDLATDGHGTLEFEIGPNGSGLLAVNGWVNIGESTHLEVDVRPGVSVQVGDSFPLLLAGGGLCGRFASMDLPANVGGMPVSWAVNYDPQGITLTVLSAGPPPATRHCFGDGSGALCPCSNQNDGSLSAGQAGCANSASAGGALLSASGSASLSNADLVFSVRGLPQSQPGIVFQGSGLLAGGLPFGDGLRCAGGGIIRLGVYVADGCGTLDSDGTDIGLLGGVSGSDTRQYQYWYRDSQGSPCGSGFNLSNALEVQWTP